MNRMVYIVGIAIVWAAFATAFYLVKDWEFFKSIIIIFIGAAVALGYLTIVLLGKAVSR